MFRSLTGLSVPVFDALTEEVLPVVAAADVARLDHPDRERAIGGGRKCGLVPVDQVLLAVVWLRWTRSSRRPGGPPRRAAV